MKLPRDLSSNELITILTKLGYKKVRQSGSHIRMTHPGPPEHHITIPLKRYLNIGTLNAILSDVARHLEIDKNEIFGK